MFDSVDELVKCEKWIGGEDREEMESKSAWWLKRLIGRTKKIPVDWPFPFSEDKLFVLTLSAGLEGYHINIDGRHVTSFPYRTVSNIIEHANLKMDLHKFLILLLDSNRALLLRMPLALL